MVFLNLARKTFDAFRGKNSLYAKKSMAKEYSRIPLPASMIIFSSMTTKTKNEYAIFVFLVAFETNNTAQIGKQVIANGKAI